MEREPIYVDFKELANEVVSSHGKYDDILQAMYTYSIDDDPSGIQDSWIIDRAFEMMGYDSEEASEREYDNMAEAIRKAANYLENMGVFEH